MRFFVEHHTSYRFSGPVFLEPHAIRLTPRQDAAQRLLSFSMELDPAPAGRWEGQDQENNPLVQAWFDGMHPSLSISTRLEAETLRTNPFGFYLAHGGLPLAMDRAEAEALAPCLGTADSDPSGAGSCTAGSSVAGLFVADPSVADMARELAEQNGSRALDFLIALNARIFESLDKIVRREPGIQTPAETLATGRGACRDAAVLFMACCRAQGIPARFVSGYHVGDEENPGDDRDLHAWAEAWLPGAGWLGFDPTHGLAAADRHLALAASHDPTLAAPLIGAFRGTGVTAALEHQVAVRVRD